VKCSIDTDAHTRTHTRAHTHTHTYAHTQFTRTLDILEDWLAARQWGAARIDGTVPGAAPVEAFLQSRSKCCAN